MHASRTLPCSLEADTAMRIAHADLHEQRLAALAHAQAVQYSKTEMGRVMPDGLGHA